MSFFVILLVLISVVAGCMALLAVVGLLGWKRPPGRRRSTIRNPNE